MPATVTLSTTTLTYGIDSGAGELTLASVSGIDPKDCLWIDRELLSVLEVVAGTTRVKVRRGFGGTAASTHSSSTVVTIGRGDQFYSSDPVGAPSSEILVSPYINTTNGTVWYAQGDATPSGRTFRWWENVTTTYGYGSLGIRTQESAPTSST